MSFWHIFLHPLQFHPALFFSQCLLCFCSSPVEGTANSDWKLWRIMLPLHSLLAASQIWILRGIINDSFAFEILNSVPDLLDEKDPNENQSKLVEERQNNIHVYYIKLLEYYKWHLNMHMGISVAGQMKRQRNQSVTVLKWKVLTQKRGKVRTIWKCCDVVSFGKKERSQRHCGMDHRVATPQISLA